MDAPAIKEKIRFRILIIGRANAGKTTILQRVCNTSDDPEIFNSAGKKINSRERGDHDIANETVFQNNPGFVFHDSRGFQAGGESEFDNVTAFIEDRSKQLDIKDQIHIIWYCIPMDEESRSFTEAERKFFFHCDTGSIPVIVLFTKFDALYDGEFSQLRSAGTSRKDAKQLAPRHAEQSFANGPQVKFLYESKDIKRPPNCHVCLADMDKEDADCGPLIERTAGSLKNEVPQQLFVSTQQTNLELCMKYAVERTLARLVSSEEEISYEDILARLSCWFPHIQATQSPIHRKNLLVTMGRLILHGRAQVKQIECLDCAHREEMKSKILGGVASGSSPLEKSVQLSSAAVIIFEHSFYIFNKDQKKSIPSVSNALKQYMASTHAAAVRKDVSSVVQAYQKAGSTGCSQETEMKAQLIKTILEITLQNRLPRP